MYYTEILLRYGVTPEEIAEAYFEKHNRNMGRDYQKEYETAFQAQPSAERRKGSRREWQRPKQFFIVRPAGMKHRNGRAAARHAELEHHGRVYGKTDAGWEKPGYAGIRR
mgnify:CR=1 FL=1